MCHLISCPINRDCSLQNCNIETREGHENLGLLPGAARCGDVFLCMMLKNSIIEQQSRSCVHAQAVATAAATASDSASSRYPAAITSHLAFATADAD